MFKMVTGAENLGSYVGDGLRPTASTLIVGATAISPVPTLHFFLRLAGIGRR